MESMAVKDRSDLMHTAIRLKTTVTSENLVIHFPELRKLVGREIEIIVLVEGEIEDSTVPPKALQNSPHIAGSIVLDEEAVERLFNNRFK